jgi:membrane-associated protease RseP (regulator of RpoE activity)
MLGQVDPNGLASEHGLKSGDVILKVGGTKVATAADVRKAVGDAPAFPCEHPNFSVVLRGPADAVERGLASHFPGNALHRPASHADFLGDCQHALPGPQ